MCLFFKTMCFISDLYLHIFGTLVESGDDAGGILILNFFTFFYLLSASIKRPEITKTHICISSEIQGICRFIY